MPDINKYDDIIDSRDIIARIDELEDERNGFMDTIEDDDTPDEDKAEARSSLAEWDEENGEELNALKALAKEGESSPDWAYGETLIRDSYFETYAQELAEDIGAVPKDAQWPAYCIDWERAARDLKQDYFSVDFDGVDYWIRA